MFRCLHFVRKYASKPHLTIYCRFQWHMIIHDNSYSWFNCVRLSIADAHVLSIHHLRRHLGRLPKCAQAFLTWDLFDWFESPVYCGCCVPFGWFANFGWWSSPSWVHWMSPSSNLEVREAGLMVLSHQPQLHGVLSNVRHGMWHDTRHLCFHVCVCSLRTCACTFYHMFIFMIYMSR